MKKYALLGSIIGIGALCGLFVTPTLAFINSYSVDKVDTVENEVLEKRTDSSITIRNSDGSYELRSFSGKIFEKSSLNVWKKLDYNFSDTVNVEKATSSKSVLNWFFPNLAYAETISPFTSLQTYSSNGYGSTLLTVQTSSVGDGINMSSNLNGSLINIRALRNASGYYLRRSFLNFDTSSIPSTAVISSANLNLYMQGSGCVSNANSTSIEVIVSTSTATSSFPTSDWYGLHSSAGKSSVGTKTLSSITTGYNSISLNTSSSISKGNISRFALLTGIDFTSGALNSGNDNECSFTGVGYASTEQDPYLSVVYTLATSTATSTASLSDVVFGQGIIITLLFVIVLGFAFNNLHKKARDLTFK